MPRKSSLYTISINGWILWPTQWDLAHSLAVASNGNRIPGVFQHLSQMKVNKFRQRIDCICRQWHIECLQNDVSAGFVVEVMGGNLSGKGALTVAAVGLGPFLC